MTEANTRKNLLVSLLIALWTRLPVVVQAILTGLILAAVGTIPWALLVSTNAKHWSAIPWSVVPPLFIFGSSGDLFGSVGKLVILGPSRS